MGSTPPPTLFSGVVLDNIHPPFQCMFYGYCPMFIDLDWVVRASSRPNAQVQQQDLYDRATCTGLIIAFIDAIIRPLEYHYWTVYKKSLEASNLTGLIKKTLEIAFRTNDPLVTNKPIYRDIYSLVNALNKIEIREYKNSRYKLISGVIALVGGVSAALGGIMMISTLVTASYVVLVAGGIFFLFNLSIHWSDDKQNRKDYLAITGYRLNDVEAFEGLADNIRKQFLLYNNHMERLGQQALQQPPEYEMYPLESLPRHEPIDDVEYQPGYNPYAPSVPPMPVGEV